MLPVKYKIICHLQFAYSLQIKFKHKDDTQTNISIQKNKHNNTQFRDMYVVMKQPQVLQNLSTLQVHSGSINGIAKVFDMVLVPMFHFDTWFKENVQNKVKRIDAKLHASVQCWV